MQDKIKQSLDMIERGFRASGKPCLAWSGGKDSMALLHLVYEQIGERIPVVFFREPWQPWKYAFQNRIIEQWGLEVYTWHPFYTGFQQTGDEFEVQNGYRWDNFTMTCPTGITPMEEGKPWVCALDIYNRPKQAGLSAGWDAVFIGHKACDGDPIYGGDAGTRIDARILPDMGVTPFFPMRDWTHQDVFQYCEDFDVPIQDDRYEQVGGVWREREDRDTNCDYVHACTACLDRREGAPRFVDCPKLKMRIENISSRVEWTDHQKATYMED